MKHKRFKECLWIPMVGWMAAIGITGVCVGGVTEVKRGKQGSLRRKVRQRVTSTYYPFSNASAATWVAWPQGNSLSTFGQLRLSLKAVRLRGRLRRRLWWNGRKRFRVEREHCSEVSALRTSLSLCRLYQRSGRWTRRLWLNMYSRAILHTILKHIAFSWKLSVL